MADDTKRTVAEKLAAAKKKHKAYLKEKALKGVATKSKDQEPENESIQTNSIPTELVKTQIHLAETSHDNQFAEIETMKTPVELAHIEEADLPLPQHTMEVNHQTSSLPDPLSFFDNFTNVGTTFQNFTQPLTSFFNNSNKNPLDEGSEVPNQVLIEENTKYDFNISDECNMQTAQDEVNVDKDNGQQFFSYDRFKVNAVNNPFSEFESSGSSNLKSKELIDNHPVFDEFTNSIKSPKESQNVATYFENVTVPCTITHRSSQESIPTFYQTSQEESILKNGNYQNSYTTFEVKPELITVPNENQLDYEVKDEISEEISKCSSNLQSFQNLSSDMKEFIEKEQNFISNSNTSLSEGLEKTNQEFQSLIEQQNAKCIELNQKLYESEMKYSKLATDYRNLEMKKLEIESDLTSKVDSDNVNDLRKLNEDLQCHLQTIGMLVAEKTELTTLLQETQAAFKKESSQCIDLQNEIKEMKIYYSDLEHELELLKSERSNINSSQKEQAEMFEKIQNELKDTKKYCEEHIQDLLESREKLKTVTEVNSNLQKQIQELNGQLSMANIKIQQLTLQEPSHLESQIKTLIDEKASYEKQISILNNTLKTVSKEREDSNLQYQHYVEQLNDQISSLVQRLDQQQKEYEQLKLLEESRVKQIGDLEKQLQNVQGDNTSYNLQRNNSFLKKELENSIEQAQTLLVEKDQLNMKLTKALTDKEAMEKELEGCKFSVSQLESTVEQLKGSQPDNAVLLATMESDKVAASRAISQNNELKKQMEGMQEAMLKVNNDNVQLTETMSIERRTNKELLEKLQKTEISFQTLAEAIEIKDKELLYLRNQVENMSKQIVHYEQLSDRLRHYEAQNHSSSSLQLELQESKKMIANLTNELNNVKGQKLIETSQINQTVPINQVHQMNQTVPIDQMNRLNQTNQIDQINQKTQTGGNEIPTELTNSEEELRIKLNDLQIRNRELESLLLNYQSHTKPKSVDTNGNEHLDKETAMMHLEKKFLRTMEEIARLTEEKQRLEHLVLQLQGETETIGEYVTLYQQQRSILKQRALEKDQQLQQLTNDRETMKTNLDRLNNLVKKLIVEKGTIPKELLDQHEHFTKDGRDLCTEHQKIQNEINKIASNNGPNNSEFDGNTNTEIAEEIISILSEIKSSNLVQPNEESIHHCPWCSGKLITV